MMTNLVRCFVASLLLASLSACRNRPGNGNPVDELPAELQKAVNDVVAQLESTSQAVIGSFEAVAGVDINPDDDTYGDCPEVIFVREENVSTFGLTYEAGCESEYYDDLSVSGSISVIYDGSAQALDIDFEAFTVDGQSTTGDLHISRTDGGDFRTWSGSIDLSTTGVGSIVGDNTLVLNVVTSTITIESASLTLTSADGASYSVEVDGIVIRPLANGNFIPQAGTVTIQVPNADESGPETITVVVEFDQNSPVDGTVRVTFNGGTVENYPLTGF